MRIKEEDIMHENGDFWVLRTDRGFEVLENTITHAEVRMHIGNGAAPNLGLERAIYECNKRAKKRAGE